MSRFLLIVIAVVLVVAIAIISVQNATPVSLQFLAFRSVALPFGLWLGLGLATGMLVTASVLTLGIGQRL